MNDPEKPEPAEEFDEHTISAMRDGISLLSLGMPLRDTDTGTALQKLTGGAYVDYRDKETPGRLQQMLDQYLSNKNKTRER